MGPMTTTPATLDALQEDFALLDNWEDRYRYLIDLGRGLRPMPDALKTAYSKVEGCMSQVWVTAHTRTDDGGRVTMDYLADSDAIIVRGLIAVLLAAYSGLTPAEAAATDVGPIFDRLGLGEHLSLNRRNGFVAMIGRLRDEARRLSGPQNSGT